jgi:hypothetical protein
MPNPERISGIASSRTDDARGERAPRSGAAAAA